MSGADTLFETFEGAHSGTVEVLSSVYKDDEDGYAVLEVRNIESDTEFFWSGRLPTSIPATGPR